MMMDADRTGRGQSRTAIYRRTMARLRTYVTAFPDHPIPNEIFEPMPSRQTQQHANHQVNLTEEPMVVEQGDISNGDVPGEGFGSASMYASDRNEHDIDSNHDHSEIADDEGILNCMSDSGNSNDTDRDSSSNYESDDNEASSREPIFNVNAASDLDAPLIAKSHITAKDHLLSTVGLSICNNWTYEATLDVLRWIKVTHELNDLPTTKAALWKCLSRNDACVSRHYYCKLCGGYLGKKSIQTGKLNTQCPCKACGTNTSEANSNYFLYVNLTSQIKQFFTIPNIAESLKYRFQRKKVAGDAFEDIYDGEEYKAKCLPGNILENWFNFSFTFNTDGCKISNSSNSSAWPIYVQINELPPHLRKKHMLMAGIYVDSGHPSMNHFLRAFVMELRELYATGIRWSPSVNESVTSKFVVIMASLDAPARAAVTCMTQFNGRHGCLYCYASGTSVGPGKFVYPVSQSFGELRTHVEVIADMEYVSESGHMRNGVKSYSSLVALPEFDICKGVVVEAMHAVYLGVTKQHTKLLLTTTRAPFYVGSPNQMKLIDKVLLSIKPPSRRSRKPRSISSYAQWKASEWRNWLDYAPMCLKPVLNDEYISHLAHLSEAIHYLNNESITLQQLDRAEYLLRTYVKNFEQIFGISSMTSNVHALTHLTGTVRNWGPIWGHSAFVFESWNKKIMDCVTSSQARADQIATRFLMRKFILTSVLDDTISIETKDFIKRTMRTAVGSTETDNKHNFVGLGRSVIRKPFEQELRALKEAGYEPVSMKCFNRIILNRVKYRTKGSKALKFCDSIISIDNITFGLVNNIAQFDHNGVEVRGLFVTVIQHEGFAFDTQYINRTSSNNDVIFVQDSAHIRPALQVSIHNTAYIVRLANCWETD